MKAQYSLALCCMLALACCSEPSPGLASLIMGGRTQDILGRRWSAGEVNAKTTNEIELRGRKFKLVNGTALHLAAAYSQPQVLSHLIESGGNVAALDSLMRTPLSYAGLAGCQVCVDLLVAAKANVDHPDNMGNTPLMLASARSQLQAVLALLANRADPLKRNKNGNTALMQACLSSVVVTAGKPLESKTGENLLRALPPPPPETARVVTVLSRVSNIEEQDRAGLRAVHFAVSGNNLDSLRVLANAGANLKAKDHNGLTPLHYSSLLGRMACAKMLLKVEGSIQAIDSGGRRPIDYAQGPEMRALLKH